jgi:hypothetical protein
MGSDTIAKTAEDLLKKNRGLFIGEVHTNYDAQSFVASQLPKWKELGVTTLYVEYNMYKAAAVQGGKDCTEQYMGPSTLPKKEYINTMRAVIRDATAAGIRVIGHDSFTGHSWSWDQLEMDTKLENKLIFNGSAFDARDDFAAQVINKTYDGKKFIVYGGAAHSGNEIKDRPSQKGLDEKLGIPSIDFNDLANAGETSLSRLIPAVSLAYDSIANGQNQQIKKNTRGNSTYDVGTLEHRLDYFPQGAVNTDEGRARLKKAAEEAKQAGVCKLPEHLKEQHFLSGQDIEQLAQKTNKKGPQR